MIILLKQLNPQQLQSFIFHLRSKESNQTLTQPDLKNKSRFLIIRSAILNTILLLSVYTHQ